MKMLHTEGNLSIRLKSSNKIDDAERLGITILQTFAQGLKLDYDAVKAAMISAWSNGQVEGQVNKLKFIKRQMYGRANFDLLRKRVLLAQST